MRRPAGFRVRSRSPNVEPKEPVQRFVQMAPENSIAAGKEEEDKAMEIRAGEEEINGK